MKNALIFGGSGYIGSEIIAKCEGFNFINVSKTRKNLKASNNILIDITKGVEFLNFDVKIDTVVNVTELYDCIDKNPRCYADTIEGIVEFVKNKKVKNFIHFSNFIPDNTYHNDYIHNKLLADKIVENAGINYVIFKTTQIFGDDSTFDRFIENFKKSSFLPSFIADKRVAPVYINDVIDNLRYVLAHKNSWNHSYILCGPELLSLSEAVSRYRDNGKIKVFSIPPMMESFIKKLYLRENFNSFYKYYIELTQFNKCIQNPPIKPMTFF